MRRGNSTRRHGPSTRARHSVNKHTGNSHTGNNHIGRNGLRGLRPLGRSLAFSVGLALALSLVVSLALPPILTAQASEPPGSSGRIEGTGRIEGLVQRPDGTRVPGVTVVAERIEAEDATGEAPGDRDASPDAAAATVREETVTDEAGQFFFPSLAPGDYTLRFSLGTDLDIAPPTTVSPASLSKIAKTVDWMYSVAETVTVYSASRRTERIVEAPAAVSVVSPETIEREAATGQLPKLLESLPGAEITQSGLFDFKLNVRGVNGTVNRRVAVLIDGRNPSFPILDTQEWYTVSFPLDDIATAELVRGPSSALYGANAFNGVLNLTTRSPSATLGGFARLTAGDLSTTRFDFRTSNQIGDDLFLKIQGGYHESEDFYQSRVDSLEYSRPCTDTITTDCLFLEAAPLPLDEDKLAFGNIRLDKDFDERRTLAVEAGYSDTEGPLFSTNSGRFQLIDVTRPWARINFNTPRWNALAYYNDREAEALTLLAGSASFADSHRLAGELQGWWQVGEKGRLVAGAWAQDEEVDTANPQGVQTLLFEVSGSDKQAVFAQLDWEVSDRLKLVGAARWDDSSLHDDQLSPKVALVWAPTPRHTFRLGYNEAFLSPNYPEFFLRVPLAPPLDLSPFEAFCTPAGVDCGFGRPVDLLAVGNENLDVESIESFELGYNALLGHRSFLTVDLYRTQIQDFVQVLVPQLGTRLGRANPDFGPYAPPSALPDATAQALLDSLQGALGPLFFLLSNDSLSDDPIFALNTIVNFGEVETRGAEVSFNHALNRRLSLDFNYAYLDFEVQDELPEAPLAANGPEHKANLGLTYNHRRLSASANLRWVDDFRWAEGLLRGPVPSYEVLNVAGIYDVTDAWQVGLNVSNLLDDVHYEAFSGDLLERRVVAHVGFSW